MPLKKEDDLNKIWTPPLKKILPDISWPLTLTAMGQLISNQKCYQVSKPEMEVNMMNIIYMECTGIQNIRHFHEKTSVAKLYKYILKERQGKGPKPPSIFNNFYIEDAHTNWKYSARKKAFDQFEA